MEIRKKYDMEFFWVCLKIGLGVLVYRIAIDFISPITLFLSIFISMFLPNSMSVIASMMNLSMAAASIIAFALGASVMWILLHIGKKRNYQKIHKSTKFIWTTPLIVIAAVAFNFVLADLNARVMSYISLQPIVEIPATTEVIGTSLFQIFTSLFATAVVPAICEEIAFRGLIMTNLEPYGKGTAIFGSALLFGLMHMNPNQFLYTTMFGLVFGLVYAKTKSIWLCMLIHFANNGIAVVSELLYYSMGYNDYIKISAAISLSIIVLGSVSAVILALVYRRKRKHSPAEVGSFGRVYDLDLGYEAHPVTKKRKVLIFFSSTITIFTLMVFSSMAMTVLLAFIGLA